MNTGRSRLWEARNSASTSRPPVSARTDATAWPDRDKPLVTLDTCGLVALKLPRERAVKAGKHPTMVALQTTRTTPPDQHELGVKVTNAGRALTFRLDIELVRKVG